MRFKIGDRVKIGRDTGDEEVGIISQIEGTQTNYPYSVEGSSSHYSEEHLTLITPTLEDMPEGTIIKGNNGDRKVLFVLKPGLYVVSGVNNFDVADDSPIHSTKDLTDFNYTIKDQESDTVEIVVEGNTKTISRLSAKELGLI